MTLQEARDIVHDPLSYDEPRIVAAIFHIMRDCEATQEDWWFARSLADDTD